MPVNTRRGLAALLAIVIIAQPASALAQDDTRAAIMGHEAFMERCVDDDIAHIADRLREELDEMSPSDADQYLAQVRNIIRRFCDDMYEEVNVCVDGGALQAIESFNETLATVSEKLFDPLTRASEFKALEGIKLRHEVEIEALRDLIAGESDHCEGSNQ